MPRIVTGSLTAYLISQLHDVWAFQFWKRRKPGTRFLWMHRKGHIPEAV
jgi:queuosine precursor transporter